MKTRFASILAVVAATPAFHAPAAFSQTAGAIIGGLTGGLLCNGVGKGNGHTMAVATCAVFGSHVGSYVQNGQSGYYNQANTYDPHAAERQRRMQWEQEQRQAIMAQQQAAMARQRQMEQERRYHEQQMRNQQHGYYPQQGYQAAQYQRPAYAPPPQYVSAPASHAAPHTTVVIIEREVIYRDREPAPRKPK